MHKVIVVLSLFFCFGCSSAQKVEKNDWTKENLVSKVQKLVEHQYKPLGENSVDSNTTPAQKKENLGLRQKSIRTYNKAGYIEEIIFSARGGNINSRRLYEYSSNSKMIKNHNFAGFDTLPMMTNEFFYNAQDEVTEIHYLDRSVLKTKTIFENNPGERTRVGKVHNLEGTVLSEIKMELDENDHIINKSKFDREGQSMSSSTRNKYDQAGNLRRIEYYQPVGNNFSITQLNEKGQEFNLMKYRDGILTTACNYEYDEKGNQIRFHCDVYENQVKRVVESDMKYDYDTQGNWVRKETSYKGNVTYVVEREYVYY